MYSELQLWLHRKAQNCLGQSKNIHLIDVAGSASSRVQCSSLSADDSASEMCIFFHISKKLGETFVDLYFYVYKY